MESIEERYSQEINNSQMSQLNLFGKDKNLNIPSFGNN
jgi:hypothetical protein